MGSSSPLRCPKPNAKLAGVQRREAQPFARADLHRQAACPAGRFRSSSASRGQAPIRWRPLSSNVRPHSPTPCQRSASNSSASGPSVPKSSVVALRPKSHANSMVSSSHSWIDAGRLDDLIQTILANHGRDGGLEEIIVLGHHFRETRDEARIHVLFRGLLSRRVKAFHEWWPRAAEGHVGCMQASARASAEAMDAYIEYFTSLDRLGLVAQLDELRAEMKRFQAREPAKNVLPKTVARRGGA